MFAAAITGPRSTGLRAISTPSGIPRATAIRVEMPTIHKCSRVRSATFPPFCTRKVHRFMLHLAADQIALQTPPYISQSEVPTICEIPAQKSATPIGPVRARRFLSPDAKLHANHGSRIRLSFRAVAEGQETHAAGRTE